MEGQEIMAPIGNGGRSVFKSSHDNFRALSTYGPKRKWKKNRNFPWTFREFPRIFWGWRGIVFFSGMFFRSCSPCLWDRPQIGSLKVQAVLQTVRNRQKRPGQVLHCPRFWAMHQYRSEERRRLPESDESGREAVAVCLSVKTVLRWWLFHLLGGNSHVCCY